MWLEKLGEMWLEKLGAEVNALLVRPERLTSQKALREHVLRRWWR